MAAVTSTPIHTVEANYIVKVREAHGISMNSLLLYDCYVGEIVRIDSGAVAYSTKYYNDTRTARLQAARYIKRYEHHLAKNGIGFEEQEAARKAEERAARDAKRARDRRVRDEAGNMLGVIRQLYEGDTTPAAIDALLADCRAIIARIDGEA